ncbi:acyl carrier protein [Rhodocytophaga rosea]|uniref:Acyl carrier protein n=1 Tax=Rhodocytophaga rosea TaxID=2704465 RepID=A0A6C0GP09_9BACT|nr:phosphopantetheine-binding protein [Rhodocytophaga rosea]QHT69584.1 acyl carrier protein [Rhodocytophaga rosea]
MRVTIQQVKDIIKEADLSSVDPETLLKDVSLSKQGVDSLEKTTIFFLIEEKYAIKISDSLYQELDTIEAIMEYLNKNLPQDK